MLSQTQYIGDWALNENCPADGGTRAIVDWDGSVDGDITSDLEATNSITIKNAVIRPGADGSATTLRITNGSAQELIVFNTYDALGQLTKKKVGGVPGSKYDNTTGLQEVAYKYNVRGWLTQINDPGNTDKLFNFGLSYNDPKNGGTPLFNGNISETAWRTDNDDDSSLKYYSYSYDPLNRIIAATDNTNNYNVSNIGYDKNGNIQTLNRNGYQDSSTFTDMDVLDYDYDNGNKLLKVADTGNKAHGFKDGTNTNDDFEYDINGNLEIDRNKGITSITYNHLNLPEQVNFGSDNIKYVYDATGSKLKRTSSSGTETLYAGNFIYEGGVGISELQFFSHPEGYVTPDNQGGYDYVYNYVDHLGSVRLSYTDADDNGSIDPANEIIEDNAYYPFGLLMRSATSSVSPYGNSAAKRWKYNGKELDESFNIDTYDFGARNYDPTIGRWMNLDPLAHKYPNASPYNYVLNSPLFYIDPDGQRIIVNGEEDRTKLLELLHGVYGDSNFSFNDDNELQFDGKLKDFKGDSKTTLKTLKGIIDDDKNDTFVKLSGFSEAEKKELDGTDGASTTIVTNDSDDTQTSYVLMDETKLKDPELFTSTYHYIDENGQKKSTSNKSDVPEGVKSFIGFSKVFQNGKPQTVPHGGGSIGIMHEFFHVSFEGENQRKINRFDNKVRNILGVPKRSVDDPEHNSGTN